MIKLIKFGAKWCAPCKKYDPILDKYQEDNPGDEVIRIDIDDSPEEAKRYNVQTVPYTVIYVDDDIVGGFKGAVTLKKLEEVVDRYRKGL